MVRSVFLVLASTLACPAAIALRAPAFTRRNLVFSVPSALTLTALPGRVGSTGTTQDAEKEKALVAELRQVRKSLEKLPPLLDQGEWDAVRTVLKNPPAANLWNLGASRNTIRNLAAARGDDVEVMEFVDDVAGALQLADQFTYDNVFIYFQPGNGKAKVKEPKDQVRIAMKKLDELLQVVGQ